MWGNMTELKELETKSGPTFEFPLSIRILVIALNVLTLIVGVFGNMAVILVFTCMRNLRNSPNILLTNLSIADLLLLIICSPLCAAEAFAGITQFWLLGQTMCKLILVVIRLVSYVSILTMLATSFERYFAICHPLKAVYKCTTRRAILICIATWLISLMIVSPVISFTTYIKSGDVAYCSVRLGTNYWTDVYTVTVTIFFFFFPLLLFTALYARLAVKLSREDSTLLAKKDEQDDRRSRKQVVKVLVAVVITFYVCLLPHRILLLLNVSLGPGAVLGRESTYYISYFTRLMLHLNAAANPIIYSLVSSKFRAGFRELWGRLHSNLCMRMRRY